jgi:ribosomal protein S18 acetylase RimI-like enzyme
VTPDLPADPSDVRAPGTATDVPIRRAASGDLEPVLATLVSGFWKDPLYRWLYPDEGTRAEHLVEVFRLVIGAGLATGSVWVSADLQAVAVWTQAGVELVDDELHARYVTLLEHTLGSERAADATAGMAATAAHVPSVPHDTLHSIAIHARRQGQGLGTGLLQPLLADCDRRGRPAHLDSSNQRNVAFYRRLGFEQTAETRVPGGGPVMRTMWRPARAPDGAHRTLST